MKTKIFYLLLLCLMVLGRGEVWAETYTLSKATLTSASEGTATFNGTDSDDATLKGGGLTIYGSGRSYQEVSGTKLIKYSAGYTYTISLPESKSGERIVSVKFEGCANAADKTSYMSNFNGTSYTAETSPVTFPTNSSSTSYTFSGDAITSTNQATFIVASTQTGLIITVTTEEKTIDNIYSDTYPYTWDFTVERSKWTKSISEMRASGSGYNWAFNNDETEARPTMTLATSNSLDDIDIIRGLRFTTSNANSLCLDWTNQWMWLDGSVTLPALSRGHKVTIVSAAAPTSVSENLTLKSSSGNTYEYLATANIATPEFAFGGTSISSIAVVKTTPVITRSGKTSEHLKSNPPTLTIGASSYWGNYAFNIIEGISNSDFSVSLSPSGIITAPEMKYTSDNGGYYYITLNAVTSGTAHVTVNLNAVDGFEAATPYEFDVRVVQNAIPKKWNFESASYWSTTSDQLSPDYWEESSDATANPYEVMSKVAFNNTELTKDGTNKIPEMEGLIMTAVKGSSRFNIGQYYRLGNYSKASITIPYVTTGQTVTFKVETATSGMERGITATSSNLELISGQVSDKVSYYTYRVTSDGDAVFRQTSEDAGLKIYYIDLKAATPAATELKFVDASGNDISNTQVNIPAGTSGNLDSYFKLSKSAATEWSSITVTYDGGIITADNSSSWTGSFTLGSSTGTATILARTESSSTETGIAVLYVSVKNQPTVRLSANGPFSVNYGQDFNNNTSTVTGTPKMGETTISGLTVKYKSSNERVAKVGADGHVTCVGVGTATITAYTEETPDYLPAEASYQVTYTRGNVVFEFVPTEINLPLGTNIVPFLHYDQNGSLDKNTLGYEISKSDVVNCEIIDDPKQSDKKVIEITSIDNASLIGETVILTAKMNLKNESTTYYTTIAVTITDNTTASFHWVDGNDIYMYEGYWMPIPNIVGNASGNNSYSNGSNHAYYYSISNKGVVTWNNKNYHLREGVPNYSLINDNGTVSSNGRIFYGNSDKSDYPDTLLIQAVTPNTTMRLHAVDSQTDVACEDIIIHILPISALNGENSEEVSTISYPYTWDFTKDFSDTDLNNTMYWTKEDDNKYSNSVAFMNTDFSNGNVAMNRYLLAGSGHTMPLFKGMQLSLGNSSFNSKIDRVRLTPNAGNGNPHLYINGGTHKFFLPRPGKEGAVEPERYKVYVKVQSNSYDNDKNWYRGKVFFNITNDGGELLRRVSFEGEDHGAFDTNEIRIFSTDINRGENVEVWFADTNVYWIAFSTEEKHITQPDAVTTYPASTYSYTKALDLDKSAEVNTGLETYYASGFASSKVTMSPINGSVEKNTGLLLRLPAQTTGYSSSSYMIADAENKDEYSEPSRFGSTTNYLHPTGKAGMNISRFDGDNDNPTATNYVFTYEYTTVYDDDLTDEGTSGTQGWSFLRAHGTLSAGGNLAYLKVPNKASEIDTEYGANSRVIWGIAFEDEPTEATEIKGIKSSIPRENDDDGWYTLQGVKVAEPVKGRLYIHKGKKLVKK